MTSEQYARLTAPLRAHPQCVHALVALNTALTTVGFIAYPCLLLVLLMVMHTDAMLLMRYVLVPAVAFFLITAFRALYNAPRPYEVLSIDPLIAKSTHGKSCPSRHAFSMFMIALCWLSVVPVCGCCLLVVACLLAVVRVLGGVHFPHEVFAGALCAFVAYIVGFAFL